MTEFSFSRYTEASKRLAKIRLRSFARRRSLALTIEERITLYNKAMLPWAWVKLLKRLWAHGHDVMGVDRDDILR
jgi:hypothetical protein